MSRPTLRAVLDHLEQHYPTSSAQSWDQVGLVTGEADAPVGRVLVAVDPTLGVIAEAQRAGADLILTHHPLLLRGVHSIAPVRAKGAALTALVRANIALYCAHTNADVAEHGVGTALAAAVGLLETQPLQIAEGQELGLVGDLAEPTTLSELATRLAAKLPCTAVGVRVAGPPQAQVRRVAVLGGAGDHAFDDVRASGAEVYVTADLRHHPALEAREEARVTARLSGHTDPDHGTPYLIDAGHYASEWLWLPLVQQVLTARFPDLEVQISRLVTDPWTFVVGAADDDLDGTEEIGQPSK